MQKFRLLTLAGLLATLSQVGWGAAICTSGSLSTYVALSAGGCMIGTDTLSGFQLLGLSAGALPIAPASILVTPSGDTTSPTLTFSTNVSTISTLEALFTYRISGNTFTGSMITLSNTSSSGDGNVTGVQNLCGGGVFGPNGVSGCTGATLGPLVVISPDTDQTTFSGVSFLSVTDDFTIDGGTSGSASGGTYVDKFTATPAVSTAPEPGAFFIAGFGAAILLTIKKLQAGRLT